VISTQRGLTMVELMLALVVGALILGALNGVVDLALRASASGRQDNEIVYQAGFAIERIASKARATPPKLLTAPALAGTTGDWFSPTMYCLKGGNRLVETTVSDTSCTGANVIADKVMAFSAQLPAGAGPVDHPLATITLTMQGSAGPITLGTSVRLRGSAL